MPRLPQTEAQKQYSCLLEKLAGYREARRREGWDKNRIASSLGFRTTTLQCRRKAPENFTLSELQTIANALNITIPTLLGYNSKENCPE